MALPPELNWDTVLQHAYCWDPEWSALATSIGRRRDAIFVYVVGKSDDETIKGALNFLPTSEVSYYLRSLAVITRR